MAQRMSPGERRDALVSFGRGFFAENPADALSMDEIAARAGVSKGLLYNYFGGRRGFYVATVRAIAEEVSALTRPDPEDPPERAVADAMRRYLRWVRAHDADYRVLVQGGLGVDPEVAEILEALRRELAGRVLARLGVPRAEAMELAAYGWVCFAEHACLEWLRRDAVDEARMLTLLRGALRGALAGAGEVDASARTHEESTDA